MDEEETSLLSELVKFLTLTEEFKTVTESFEQEVRAASLSSSSSVSLDCGSSTSSLNDSFSSFSSSTFPDGTGNHRLFNMKVKIRAFG